MREQGDPDEADRDGPEIAEERDELRAGQRAGTVQRLADQHICHGSRCDGAGKRCEDRSAETQTGRGEDAKKHEAHDPRQEVQARESGKALEALQDARCDGKHEGRRQREDGQDDGRQRIDVEQPRERLGQRQADDQEGRCGDQRCAQHAAGETGRVGLIARGVASRDLPGDSHLEGSRRDEHDGEQAEQGRKRAVLVAAEDPAGGQ